MCYRHKVTMMSYFSRSEMSFLLCLFIHWSSFCSSGTHHEFRFNESLTIKNDTSICASCRNKTLIKHYSTLLKECLDINYQYTFYIGLEKNVYSLEEHHIFQNSVCIFMQKSKFPSKYTTYPGKEPPSFQTFSAHALYK